MKKAIFTTLGDIYIASCLIFLVPFAFGQTMKAPVAAQPFGLKGDVLGETLEQFRARNNRVIHSNPGAVLSGTKHLPECTNDKTVAYESLSPDVEASAETEDEQRAGVIKCIAALSMDDDLDFDDEPTVANIVAYRTIYYFFGDRLYEIESELPRSEYRNLRNAFISKYGSPLTKTIIQYQNGFGAKFTGERLLWRNQFSKISIGELDGQSNNVRLVFWDKDIGKQCEIAGAEKGRSKDL